MDIEKNNLYHTLAKIAIKSISKDRPMRKLSELATITCKHSNDCIEIDDGIYDKIYIMATEATVNVIDISLLKYAKCDAYVVHLFNDKHYDYIYEYLRLVSYSAYDTKKLADILIPVYTYKNLDDCIISHIKECINGIDDIHYHDYINRLFYTFSDDDSESESEKDSVVTSDEESVVSESSSDE